MSDVIEDLKPVVLLFEDQASPGNVKNLGPAAFVCKWAAHAGV
jgi:hypothetical protein